IDHQFLSRTSALYRPLRRLEEWIDRTSRVIFTSSSEARRILLQQFGCTEAQVRALPDCVETNTFVPAQQHEPMTLDRLRGVLALPAEAKVIVYLGLLAPYQGTDLLLQAMQRILAQRADVYLLLMGFPGIDIYREQAANRGITEHVRLTGRIPYQEAPYYLALGDVAVAPKLSLTESAGKLLNYMGVGIPTVAFDTPVAREYLGSDGHLAQRGNADDLAKMLLQALDEPEKGQTLRQSAIDHFSWASAGQQIVAAYDELTQPSERVSSQHVEKNVRSQQAVKSRANDHNTKLAWLRTLRSKWLRSKGMVIQE
ncbi:MAG: glycosyltransferase family 4 protein, partial [Caldilineaceae bacterium]|nr:glycosyltransferase family 4 protein [Caldilineaceae bacterium]